ncbi:MAG TPA: FAD-binding protein [Candidatus Limnocylindria bacterium]|jgi:glycolate oxidase FAD binding subunit
MTTLAERLAPNTYEACAVALGSANAQKKSIRVRGGGTKDYLGDLVATDLVLETSGLRGIVAHVPADLTVTVAAGTALAEVQRALGEHGQVLPLDPPHAAAATVGGVIAANSSGFLRARYGGVRDLLIGTTTALADGTLAHAGGRVVKNVAGYDLNKLLVGSLGTLGVIVECTFRVLPLPSARAGIRAQFKRAADAFAAADDIARTPARPAALVVDGTSGGAWQLLVLAEGAASAVERTIHIVAQAAVAHGTGERDQDILLSLAPLRDLPDSADGVLVRASLPPAAQRAFAEAALRLEGFAQLVADAASGIARVHVRGDDDDMIAAADALLAAARVCGGSGRVEKRSDRVQARVGSWGDGDLPGLFLMRRLKEAFDPGGILEPGRGPVR